MKDYDIDDGGGGAWFDLIFYFFNTTVFEIILIKVSAYLYNKDLKKMVIIFALTSISSLSYIIKIQ